MQRDIPTSTFGTGEWKNGSIVQTGYFQKASLQQKYTIRQIVKTFVLDDNKEIRVFAIMPNLALYNDMDPNFVEKLLEKTFATRKSFNTILQEMFNTCRSVKERLTIANRQARPPSLVSTPMNDKGVILAFDDNQLYVAYWNAITIIVVHFGQKARLLPPNEYFKNNWSLAKTHQIQVTRINLQPQDEYVVVASDSLLQYLTLEGIMRMINRLLRKNVPIQSIAESLVNAACSLGYRGELALHLILLRKPEWNLDVCVHGGNIYNTLRGYLPHCSQDYFSSGVSSASESTKTTSHRDKISVNSLYERKIVSDDSVLSSTPYYPSTSREEPKKDLQSEDRKDSSTFCHSKEDVEDSLLQLIKGNSHVVS